VPETTLSLHDRFATTAPANGAAVIAAFAELTGATLAPTP
jgi:hypothetical protein